MPTARDVRITCRETALQPYFRRRWRRNALHRSWPAPGVCVTPRLSSVLSAPTSTAETRRMPASRIISPTAWIFVHDDRPAVTTATASGAQVARCSPPSEGSGVSQGEQKVRRGEGGGQLSHRRRRTEPPATGAERADGSDVVAIGDRHDQVRAVHAHRADPGLLGPQRRAAGAPPHRSATTTCLPSAARRTWPVTPGTGPRLAGRLRERRPARRRRGSLPAQRAAQVRDDPLDVSALGGRQPAPARAASGSGARCRH